MYKIHLDKRHISDLESGARWLCISAIQLAVVSYQIPENMQEVKGAGASEAGGQTKEGPLSKRYFQTSKIAQNRTKSPVPIVIDVFGVTAPYGNPYGFDLVNLSLLGPI